MRDQLANEILKESRGDFAVAFPNRKLIIFDNKLEFSGTKLAES